MKQILHRILAAAFSVAFVSSVAMSQAAAQPIRIATADTLGAEDLVLLIAFEEAKARGVDIEVTPFKSDDVVFQAIVNGQMDIGVGVAYKMIQNLKAPIRHFYQLRSLAYFPVVNKEFYNTWKDLDGQDIVVHSRGSGTEALARLMEKTQGINFNRMTYVPGSEVRAIAMRRGDIKVTYLDMTRTRLLTTEDPNRFGVLPVGKQSASDEVLYASTEFLKKNSGAVGIIVEEALRAARQMNADPTGMAAVREKLKLLAELPKDLNEEITSYHRQAAMAGLFPPNGGGENAARADFEFLTSAGRLDGSANTLDVGKYWDLAPLNAALGKMGYVSIDYSITSR
ncbi:MAG: ABC transporter substrate-binding protein [Candidatus Latescibacteria bacterium]|jgi:NitT/TauT family transport system substrate-binding protein|nr:nitrate ABC transporter substrate-binding protein [Chloroflexota bacterium]MDP7238706.1 ABC transporter substrate-binding protein [Candidatus Latescibacterota bacterium]|tara:strand:- start:483 stop:1502 length:1020 start_codon:yes stop_codon:yes gene_type:complete